VPALMCVRALSLAARERTAQPIGLLFDVEIARAQGALAWELEGEAARDRESHFRRLR
jgi:hypothetical protein